MKIQTGLYRTYKDMLHNLPKIGNLQIIDFSRKDKYGNILLKCQCECGTIIERHFSYLNKNTCKTNISCGCLHKEIAKNIGLSNRKFTINSDKLVDNSETAYIAGLLGADGYLTKAGIGIGLQEEDSYLLKNIMDYFEFDGKLDYKDKKNIKHKNQCRFNISEKSFLDFYKERGIIKNKSLKYIVPEQYLLNNDFWRGILDGDGCIFKYNYKHKEGYTYDYFGFSIVGTKDCVEKFKKYIEYLLQENVNKQISDTGNGVTFKLSFVGIKYFSALEKIYTTDTNLIMNRKYKKVLDIRSFINSKMIQR